MKKPPNILGKLRWNRNLIKPYIGKRFGQLVVTGFGKFYVRKRNGSRIRLWRCHYDCGKNVDVQPTNLKQGLVRSCGCYRKAYISKLRWKGYGLLSRCYFYVVKKNAKARHLPMKISIKYMWSLFVEQGGLCALTGVKLKMDPKLHESKRKGLSLITQTE